MLLLFICCRHYRWCLVRDPGGGTFRAYIASGSLDVHMGVSVCVLVTMQLIGGSHELVPEKAITEYEVPIIHNYTDTPLDVHVGSFVRTLREDVNSTLAKVFD